jgi:alcohol dehydrogenase class IV
VVEEIAETARLESSDCIIGLGGGSCLDAAKAAAMLLTNAGSLHEYLMGKPVENQPVPVMAIPTTFGTGSEATAVAVIGNPEAGYKKGLFDRYFYPRVALVDPELGRSMPPTVAAATGMDAFAHALEAYTSQVANPFSDALALKAVKLIYKHIPNVTAPARDMGTLEALASGATLAGMAFSNASTGLAHVLAERIAAFHKVPHGMLVATVLPHVIDFSKAEAPAKYAEMARALGVSDSGDDSALAGDLAEAVRRLNQTLGIPSALKELGIGSSDIPQLTAKPFRGSSARFAARVADRENVVRLFEHAIG